MLLWNAYVSPSTYDTLTAKGVMQRRVLQRYARGAHLSMSMQGRELSTRGCIFYIAGERFNSDKEIVHEIEKTK